MTHRRDDMDVLGDGFEAIAHLMDLAGQQGVAFEFTVGPANEPAPAPLPRTPDHATLEVIDLGYLADDGQ